MGSRRAEVRKSGVGELYAHDVSRLVALAFAAIAFAIGLYLPLSVYWFLHGDPGMPGGASLVIIGFPLGLIGAVSAGVFTFVKLCGTSVQSTSK